MQISEDEMKHAVIHRRFLNLFNVWWEVDGDDLETGRGVRIDAILKPKKDLIERGFRDGLIGLEFKSIFKKGTFDISHKKFNRQFAQAQSYRMSKFSVENKECVPWYIFCINEQSFLFPHLDYETKQKSVINFCGYTGVGYCNFLDNSDWVFKMGFTTYFSMLHGLGFQDRSNRIIGNYHSNNKEQV